MTQSCSHKSKYSTTRSGFNKLSEMGYDVHATGGTMSDLLNNTYMNNYVDMLKGKDVTHYIERKMKNQRPIFKNFIDNNANQKRKEV